MSTIMKKFPRDFWNRDDVLPIEVLGDLLNEIRQQTQLIVGFSEILLEADLEDAQRTDIKTIFEGAKYLETILDAGREYYVKAVDTKVNDQDKN